MDLSERSMPDDLPEPMSWQETATRLQAEKIALRDENRRLWARDHARGHRPTPDCPVCVRLGYA